MKLKEITPIAFCCGIGACPAIFETDRKTFVIIGKRVPSELTNSILSGRISDDEIAIEIPRDLLAELSR